MCIKYFAFALLWFPGVLHAQSTTQACDAPTLDGGFFAPKQETYSHGTTLSYTCNEGRKLAMKGWWATSTCHNGKWSHQPQCIESMNACSVPPKIPHAVNINQDYQEVFAAGSEVQYECEDGYTAEGAHNKKSVCSQGSWTQGPTCTSSSTSDSNNRDNSPINIQSCGAHPHIENAVIVEEDSMYLKYQCNHYYKLAGPDTVNCYSDGSWSELPTCQEAFCVMDPARYAGYGLAAAQSEYIREGETKAFHCTTNGYHANVRCTNRKIALTRCCQGGDYLKSCREFREPN